MLLLLDTPGSVILCVSGIYFYDALNMVELHENHFWHRRISQVAASLSVLIILLFVLSYFSGDQPSLDVSFQVGVVPAALAGLTLIAAVLANLWSVKKPQAQMPLLTQCLLLVTVAVLIYTTGGLYSYFLALWVPAVIFVGVFGARGLIAAAVVPLLYAVWLFLTDIFTLPMGITTLLVGEMPVLLSSLLFSHLAIQKEDSSYKQLANQYSQVSDKSEVVINAITNGVIALDKQGVIELINPEAQRLIGWESRDALKLGYKSVLKLVDEESHELSPAADPIRKALSTNEEVRTEDFRLLTNSGKKVLVSLVISPVGQHGSGVIIVFRDITKEKAEEREQAEFISTASHEMRTPVASIEGYLGLALNPATAQIDDKARSYIMKAQEVAQHLGRLFQDLLDVSKAEDGRLSNNPRVVEVVSFVQDVVEGLRPQAEAKGLILVYKPIPEEEDEEKSNRRLNPVYYANVDNDHLREVVANLVENAIKYTKEGTVSVDIGGDEKQVEISIQDTGIGIPAEDLSHLFQKFYRVDNSDTREIGGTGLGLFLCRRLVEVMEGRIWAESQHGQGSTFFVSLPRISHQEAMQLIETLGDEESPQTIGPAISGQPAPVSVPDPYAALPTPQPQPAPPSGGAVYANPSAQAVASQLTANPANTAPAQPAQPPAAPTANPTLSSIESNPGQYLSRPALTVPPRSQGASPENPGLTPQNRNQA